MTLKNKLGQFKNKLDTKLQYIDNKHQLVEYFLKGSKTKDSWRIGTEHEKFLFDLKSKKPIPYEGEISILKIFSELEKNNWTPIKEGKNVLGLVKDKKNITLEPGLQFELSGDAVQNIHQTCNEINSYLKELKIFQIRKIWICRGVEICYLDVIDLYKMGTGVIF